MGIIADPVERTERAQVKRHSFLRFLRSEIFTTLEIAARVMGVETRAARQTVAAMERYGLVKRYESKWLPGFRLPMLISITAHGQGMAFDPDAEEKPSGRVFRPGSFSLATLPHKLFLQKLRLLAEEAGWEWEVGENLQIAKGEKRPDAVASLKGKVRVAVEAERTLKNPKSLVVARRAHFAALASGKWDEVLYVSPTEELAMRVRRLFLLGAEDAPLAKKISFLAEENFHVALSQIEDEVFPTEYPDDE